MGTVQYTNTMRTLSLLLLAASAFAQETHVCDDGWDLYTITFEGVEHHSCFKFGGTEEKVAYSTALAVCRGLGEDVFMAEVPWATSTGWVARTTTVIMDIIPGNGIGNTATGRSSGSTGATVNPTTPMGARIV